MNSFLRYTLIGDGSSDSTLLEIIKWLLDDLYPKLPNQGTFADFRAMKKPPNLGDIASQVKQAQIFYPCDIIFYHRDAESREKDIINQRKTEVLSIDNIGTPIICVVPVVMMETWLLIDELAIKKAAGNRNYADKLALPALQRLENEPNPKSLLHALLKEASGLTGRRLDKFNVHQAVHLVAENIQDFSILRKLGAFQVFEDDLKTVVDDFLSRS